MFPALSDGLNAVSDTFSIGSDIWQFSHYQYQCFFVQLQIKEYNLKTIVYKSGNI